MKAAACLGGEGLRAAAASFFGFFWYYFFGYFN